MHRHPTTGLCLLALLALPSAALADSWTCRQAGLTRHVTVFYPNAPARLPCEVFYSKPGEGVIPRALWNSRHEPGYCEREAAAFVGKLRAWGWQCSRDPDG